MIDLNEYANSYEGHQSDSSLAVKMFDITHGIDESKEEMWVTIKDTYQRKIPNTEKYRSITKYRIVNTETFYKLSNGIRYHTDPKTGKREELPDPNPHEVEELGRATTRDAAKKFLPGYKEEND